MSTINLMIYLLFRSSVNIIKSTKWDFYLIAFYISGTEWVN